MTNGSIFFHSFLKVLILGCNEHIETLEVDATFIVHDLKQVFIKWTRKRICVVAILYSIEIGKFQSKIILQS